MDPLVEFRRWSLNSGSYPGKVVSIFVFDGYNFALDEAKQLH